MKLQITTMLLPFVLILGGCIKYSYIPTSLGLEPKEAHCKVQVFTRPPEQQFEQLGILNSDAFSFAAVNAHEFLDSVRDSVCQAGGDAVIADVTSEGKYIRGTVIRFRGVTNDR